MDEMDKIVNVLTNDETARQLAGSQEELRENKTINLKCQMDIEKLIQEEAKQFIYTQEQFNLRNATILQQTCEREKYFDFLKSKIIEVERNLVEQKIMAENAQKKMVNNKRLTYSTREILNKLNSYIETFQQKSRLLQTSMVDCDSQKKLESRLFSILNKVNIIENMTNKNPFSENYKNCLKKFEILSNENLQLKEMEKSLESKIHDISLQKQQIENDIQVLDKIIPEKDQENINVSEKLEKVKDMFAIKLEVLGNQKLQSLKIQKLTFERDALAERNASSEASYADVDQEIGKYLLEKSTCEDDLSVFQQELCDSHGIELCVLENISFPELEEQKHSLIRANEELNKGLSVLREKAGELIHLNCNEKLELLKRERTVLDLQNELADSQKLYSNESSHLQNRNEEELNMEKILKTKSVDMENNNKIIETHQQMEKEITARLEILRSDTAKQNIEIDYQQNILLPYLDIKLKDLNEKNREIEIKISDENQRSNEVEALNKKKKDQCQRARKYFTMFNNSRISVLPIEVDPQDIGKSEEKIEDEESVDETSKKSILKSPNPSAPQTPKKNVTFKGVPSIESASSSEMTVNANAVLDTTIFQALDGLEPLPYKVNRKFD